MMMIRLDDEKKTAPLLCKSQHIMGPLTKAENENPGNTDTAWRPEMTEFQIECKLWRLIIILISLPTDLPYSNV